MKHVIALLLCMVLVFTGCASSSIKEVYGTWYNDTDGIRNIIQLYEYDSSTKNAFIWAVYDIKADKRTSVDSGTYTLGDGTITLTYSSGVSVTLEYTKTDDTLTLIMDGAVVEFRLYTLTDTTA